MPLTHLLLALAVVFVWGTNFVVIKLGLAELPPFLFAALRFTLSAFPLVFLLKRPQAPWRKLAAFGCLLGVGQFGLLFLAMRADISPGLASLVIQSQVFFTIGLARWQRGEGLQRAQAIALALALAGIGVIAAHVTATGNHTVTLSGLLLVLCAAMAWAAANTVARSVGKVDVLAFMAWSSLFAVLPLFALSALLDGPAAIIAGIGHASALAWSAVVWQAVGNTLFGYGAWNWLLARHPAATVAPTALLVPVFGMGASTMLAGESLPGWKLLAAALVMAGLALNLFADRLRTARG
ncbi:EamA family transporter [Niveibacterium umoris]|uniref:O-acetylserine/cysteine efflux transporter n=1 Tax=Niveibacterium umoris TaxID=1193620 RepID=A0A840BTE9_9RHOO|nr:EamA family transporter [Niveibacterium umoris]MBB4014679.1 O-acetylserine/cysteine efflux transporter [Niveibacterium umoris]